MTVNSIEGEPINELQKETIKSKILDELSSREYGVSFIEIRDAVGESFKGQLAMHGASYPNIIFWGNMSADVIAAITELIDDKVIEMRPANMLVYVADGGTPNMKLAKSLRHYKKPRWLPIVFNKGKNWDKANRSHAEATNNDE